MNNPRAESESLLDLIRRFDLETHPHKQQPAQLTLDSSLERDLGLDSLGRMELLYRIERRFEVSLPDQVLATMETPRELLRAIEGASGAPRPRADTAEIRAALPHEAQGLPDHAATLTEMLEWHASHNGERTHIYLLGEQEEEETITYAELLSGAGGIAAGLRALDLQPGQTVAIMLPTGADYLFSFFGVLLAGGIPVPVYPPARLSQVEDHMRRHAAIFANAQVAILITVPEARLLGRLLRTQVDSLRHLVTPEEVRAAAGSATHEDGGPPLKAEDIAFLQYTSGSTGMPKGVVLTHTNLLANIRAMGESLRVDSTDVCVSWLPLYHDMGLISCWLGSLYYAMPLVLMSPLAFLARPERWLWTVSRYRGTISAGANFAYELCLRRIEDSAIEGLDLSSWRVTGNGAEPVSPDTIERFSERFGRFGFRSEAVKPVYGLAECTVGLAFPPFGRGPLVDRINRDVFRRTGRAVEAENDDEGAMRIVACGQPLSGHEIRVVDETGHELGEREEGRLQFKGPSATSGYYRNAEETRKLFQGEWLNSGDLAYMAGGDVYLTGRAKDLIIKAGRNIYPHELEAAVGEIPGVRKGCVAAFGSSDAASGTERLVLMVETRETGSAELEELRSRIAAVSVDLIGYAPDDIVLAPPQTVLKTSSGKLRRAASREIYEQGAIRARPRALWLQILRFAWAGLGPWLRRYRRAGARMLYAVYAISIFALVAPTVWGAVVLMPRRAWAWAVARLGCKALLGLCRIRVVVRGAEDMPRGVPVMVVTNHASYLDGVILSAALPGTFCYVAKQELEGNFVTRVFLRRLGVEFVERFDMQRGVADARRLTDVAREGRSMVFFPEGGFDRMPGLRPFHMGAFVAAAEAGIPVLPVAMRGARSVLRGDGWFPRRGTVHVHVGQAIEPSGSDWAAAIQLRDAARAEVQKHCGEPDLAPPSQPL